MTIDWSIYKDVTNVKKLPKNHRGAITRLIKNYSLTNTPLEVLRLLAQGNRICVGCSGFVSNLLFATWQLAPYCKKHGHLSHARFVLKRNEGLILTDSREAVELGNRIVTKVCRECNTPFYTRRRSTATFCRFCTRRKAQTDQRKVLGQDITLGYLRELRKAGKIYCFTCHTEKPKPTRKVVYKNHCDPCYNLNVAPKRKNKKSKTPTEIKET